MAGPKAKQAGKAVATAVPPIKPSSCANLVSLDWHPRALPPLGCSVRGAASNSKLIIGDFHSSLLLDSCQPSLFNFSCCGAPAKVLTRLICASSSECFAQIQLINER